MMDMTKLQLEALKIECDYPHPSTRKEIVSNIKDWVCGDIEGTFDYAIKHGYLEKAGEDIIFGTLWKATEKLQKYTKPE